MSTRTTAVIVDVPTTVVRRADWEAAGESYAGLLDDKETSCTHLM